MWKRVRDVVRGGVDWVGGRCGGGSRSGTWSGWQDGVRGRCGGRSWSGVAGTESGVGVGAGLGWVWVLSLR